MSSRPVAFVGQRLDSSLSLSSLISFKVGAHVTTRNFQFQISFAKALSPVFFSAANDGTVPSAVAAALQAV